MALCGQVLLIAALVGGLLATVALFVSGVARRRESAIAGKVRPVAHALIYLCALCLTLCIAVLLYCFFASDYSILYVVENHTTSTSSIAWLYRIAGVWSGAQGSLLLWAWIISLYASFIAWRHRHDQESLSDVALSIIGIVLVAFLCVLVFSADNNPFIQTPSNYLDDAGQLIGAAASMSMSPLLEHWAMAVHPPTLFIGYAGMTVPFAYALAALIVDDSSKRWVECCSRITIFAWWFLGAGIGLGAVWAYVVLGWGGYWGWDAVENASLLSWLVGVALIHSFTIYRKRGGFKRWAVLCSCLAFSFVILGTFITRSGIVESVHAFTGDAVSLIFFLALIIASLVAGVVGLIWRRDSFEDSEDIEYLSSKNTAYYFNNVLMVVCAVVVAYLTLASALPTWLPLGGNAISSGTYDALARPIGILYVLLMAACPLLAWRRTEGKDFWGRIKYPLIFALGIFAVLLFLYFTRLYPVYDATVASGGTPAANLLADGPKAYYVVLSILGLFAASALVCNTIYLFVRGTRSRMQKKGEGAGLALVHLFTKSPSQSGGYLTHIGIAILLVGLIGSSMYVTETTKNLGNATGALLTCGSYTLEYVSTDTTVDENGNQTDSAIFNVYDDTGKGLGQVRPSVTRVQATQQSQLDAAVISTPLQDLFVVYQGTNENGSLAMDVRVNPLISFVWIGFVVMMVGVACTFIPHGRRQRDKEASQP